MAELAAPDLRFQGGCPDCGERAAVLPLPIPGVNDDFDWRVRDYDSFRLAMMQELAARFPERHRWTAADVEVVIVELLAAALDRASHALDRIQAERYLDSARRPQSVRRLLRLIGYDATRDLPMAERAGKSPGALAAAIEQRWRDFPSEMERARLDGPRRIAVQERMVTLADHAAMLEAHPLVARARARLVWTGAWATILVSTLLEDDLPLDRALHVPPPDGAETPNAIRTELWDEIVAFHEAADIPRPPIDGRLSGRRLLRGMIEQYRMLGTEVMLEEAKGAPITFTLSVRARPGYFRSELRQALAQVFAADQGAFFEPGRLGFGEALYASDVIDAAMRVEGVAVACLNTFRRVGKGFEDQSADGVIRVAGDEFIRCANDGRHPENGTFRIVVNGGERA